MKKFDTDKNLLVKTKSTFIEKEGRYSREIIFNDEKTFYTDKKISYAVFGFGKLLKKDVEAYIDFFTNNLDIGYFTYNENFQKHGHTVYNVDISSAYLTALFNSKKISKIVYKKINSLPKEERLICLGLLAYEPFLKMYESGEMVSIRKIRNEFRPVFFWCVKEIFKISMQLKRKLGPDFIFSWVDGFYFTGEENFAVVENFLRTKKLKFKAYRLFNFSRDVSENFVIFNYKKRDRKNGKELMREISIVIPTFHDCRDMTEFFAVNEDLDKGNYEYFEKTFKEKLSQTKKHRRYESHV